MKTVYFIVDESGAKGFASNVESEIGEFGIVAGYFVEGHLLSRVRSDFTTFCTQFADTQEGKLHVVNLTHDQQRLARMWLFKYLLEWDMYCCYDAIYVQGLYAATERINSKLTPDVKRPPNVSYSKLRPSNPRLITEIFSKLIAKAMAYAIDAYGRDVTLKVIVDITDKNVLNEYCAGVDEIVNAFEPKTLIRNGWNHTLNRPIVHKMEVHTTGLSPNLNIFSDVKYSIDCENSELTFAADVLVGSLRHHLMKMVKAAGTVKLNSKNAIAGHELEHQIYGTSGQSLLDIMYRHPDYPS